MRWFRTENGLVARQLGREDFQVVEKQETILELDGDFTGGQLKILRLGDFVTMTTDVAATHGSDAGPATSTNFLPEWARPTTNQSNVIYDLGGTTIICRAETVGQFRASYNVARTDSLFPLNISFTIFR